MILHLEEKMFYKRDILTWLRWKFYGFLSHKKLAQTETDIKGKPF